MRSTIVLAVLLIILSSWKAFASECKEGYIPEKDDNWTVRCIPVERKKRCPPGTKPVLKKLDDDTYLFTCKPE